MGGDVGGLVMPGSVKGGTPPLPVPGAKVKLDKQDQTKEVKSESTVDLKGEPPLEDGVPKSELKKKGSVKGLLYGSKKSTGEQFAKVSKGDDKTGVAKEGAKTPAPGDPFLTREDGMVVTQGRKKAVWENLSVLVDLKPGDKLAFHDAKGKALGDGMFRRDAKGLMQGIRRTYCKEKRDDAVKPLLETFKDLAAQLRNNPGSVPNSVIKDAHKGLKTLAETTYKGKHPALNDLVALTRPELLADLLPGTKVSYDAKGAMNGVVRSEEDKKKPFQPTKKELVVIRQGMKKGGSLEGVSEDTKEKLAREMALGGVTSEDAKKVVSEYEALKTVGINAPVENLPAYAKSKVTLDPVTSSLEFDTKNAMECEKLGSGAFNTVYKVKYKNGNDVKVRVFKPEIPSCGGVCTMGKYGVDENDPQLGRRNVGMSRVSEKLGFKVICKADFAVQDGNLGIAMELAPGTPVMHIKTKKTGTPVKKEIEVKLVKVDYKDGTLRRDLTKMQLVDTLCGQLDRHCGNYVVHLDKDKKVTGAVGIDNDQSFVQGMEEDTCAEEDSRTRSVRLPPVVDSEMKEKFLKLTQEDLAEELQDLIKPEELNAAKKRLVFIQDHLKSLPPERVIKPDQWGKLDSQQESLFNDDNSYWARDAKFLKAYEKQGLILNYSEMVK
jgi:hypothetical protein